MDMGHEPLLWIYHQQTALFWPKPGQIISGCHIHSSLLSTETGYRLFSERLPFLQQKSAPRKNGASARGGNAVSENGQLIFSPRGTEE
jgi:hypothetical protein